MVCVIGPSKIFSRPVCYCYYVIYTKNVCNFNFSPPKHFYRLNCSTWKKEFFPAPEDRKLITL